MSKRVEQLFYKLLIINRIKGIILKFANLGSVKMSYFGKKSS
jgi:hypothetical protein